MRRRKTTHEYRLGGGNKIDLTYGPRGDLSGAVLHGGSGFALRAVFLSRRAVGRLARLLREEIPPR